MYIKRILSQHRRDFRAIYICEHCGYEKEGNGYDDTFFHENVVSSMVCVKCKKRSVENYRPLTTKYNDNEVI